MPPSAQVMGAMGLGGDLTGAVKEGLGMAGGAIGTAIGGPAGEAIGSQLGKMLPDLLMAPLTAAKALAGAFDGVVSAVKPFVEAFAPSSVLAFTQAMRDTSAVIGSALVPVMNAATAVVRSFGDAILPAFRELEPVVRKITDTFMKLFLPFLTIWGGQMQVAAGFLSDLADGFESAMPVWQGLVNLIQSTSAVMTGLVAGWWEVAKVAWGAVAGFLGLKGAWASVGDALRTFGLGLIRVTATLARLAGADSVLAGMRKALGADQKAGSSVGFAAAQNAQVQGVPDWARNLAVAAATAAGSVGKSPEDNFRIDALALLKDIDGQVPNLRDAVEKELQQIKAAIVDLPEQLAAALASKTPLRQVSHIRQQARDLGQEITDRTRRLFDQE